MLPLAPSLAALEFGQKSASQTGTATAVRSLWPQGNRPTKFSLVEGAPR